MTNHVIIERIKDADGTYPTNSVTLSGSYSFKGKIRILKEDGKFVSVDVDEKDRDGKLVVHNVRDYTFGANFMQLKYSYETDPSKQTSQDKNTLDTVDIFWSEHPLLLVDGKKNVNSNPLSEPMWNLVNKRDESVSKLKAFKDVLEAANKIVAMGEEKRRDVAYYYAMAPQGKTDGELLLALADFSTGVCTRPTSVANFHKVWGGETDLDTSMIVVIKKAIALSVIENKIMDGRNNYYVGNELVGTSENDLLSYSKNNKKTYEEFIVREVKAKDNFKSEKKENEKEKQLVSTGAAREHSKDIVMLRDEAKGLIKDGYMNPMVTYWSMGIDKLSAALAEANENRKNNVKIERLQPTV